MKRPPEIQALVPNNSNERPQHEYASGRPDSAAAVLLASSEASATTSDAVCAVLESFDLPAILVDKALNVRFFTRAVVPIVPLAEGDLGRPLVEFDPRGNGSTLAADARAVLTTAVPREREIEASDGLWHERRMVPYRGRDGGVEGVVVTFADINWRREAARATEGARHRAELASVAKSRSLIAASHDIRQPLQTIALLQGVLSNLVGDGRARQLLDRIDDALGAMTGTLNALLDMSEIDAASVHPEIVSFPIGELLKQLAHEFAYRTQANGLDFTVVPCSLSVDSDPRLLTLMVRSLLSNALKYTRTGKILLGCHRRGNRLSIEVRDTGVGIAGDALRALLAGYQPGDGTPRDELHGFSVVRRYAAILGHQLSARSEPGKGSAFMVEVGRSAADAVPHHLKHAHYAADACSTGSILVIEDDPVVRELLEMALREDGHQLASEPDSIAALELVAGGRFQPDLILADYDLARGLNGVEATAKLHERLGRPVPAIILTGNKAEGTLRNVVRHDHVQLHKPVELKELSRVVRHLLSEARSSARHGVSAADDLAAAVVYVVDDDSCVCDAIRTVVEEAGYPVELFQTAEAFLHAYRPGRGGCVLVDAYLPGISGMQLLQRLAVEEPPLPAIMITGRSHVQLAVDAMKAGATDFIEKPIDGGTLLASVERAVAQWRAATSQLERRQSAAHHLAGLTSRQQEIMALVLAGYPSKNIAAELRISQRTVEHHRAAIMRRTGSTSLPGLARLVVAASWEAAGQGAQQGWLRSSPAETPLRSLPDRSV